MQNGLFRVLYSVHKYVFNIAVTLYAASVTLCLPAHPFSHLSLPWWPCIPLLILYYNITWYQVEEFSYVWLFLCSVHISLFLNYSTPILSHYHSACILCVWVQSRISWVVTAAKLSTKWSAISDEVFRCLTQALTQCIETVHPSLLYTLASTINH